jgi:acyl-CoA reductase-like NAD-dependent aldehyde dehydrogenase
MNHPTVGQIVAAYSAGQSYEPGTLHPLVSPNTQQVIGQLSETPAAVVSQIVQAAAHAYETHRRATAAQRSKWLLDAADALASAADEVASLIVEDIGKPRRVAAGEVQRSVDFIQSCAREVLQIGGDVLPLDAIPAGAGHFGFTRRVPLGVVAAITPFNAPANLLCQKVAPALAMGNAVVVKPHPAATRAAVRIAQAFTAGGIAGGLFNIVTGDKEAATELVGHRLVRAVSFTGGNHAADALARAAGAKKFLSELGSNAANVVLADADLPDAARRIAGAAFEASGQQCVSAQRIIVEASVYDKFVDLFVSAAVALKVGPASDPKTDIGPMVSQAQADRVMRMARDAVALGAKFALEPKQQGCTVSPGIIVDAPRNASVWCEEAFGPIAVVERARDVAEALAMANDSEFGLQGAVFTNNLKDAFLFSDGFDVGSLWVNEASRYRLDTYPFGGSKRSGSGREGVRYAMEELSQLKFTGMRLA